ncbi:MAG: TIGR04282 family arsenosugar biosynthesis glycosyltransferase [Saprospiraceae bacterium]|nr:TIGR04282 family arsenosugar biosynthesis glycosyltransferase [Saprospiraceae bacterium]
MDTFSTQTALIIFIKNSIPGKVKTRIGSVWGDVKALEIYFELQRITRAVCDEFEGPKYLYYSDGISPTDDWDPSIYNKNVQSGEELGDRMYQAFSNVLDRHPKAIIIGSDCPYLQLNDFLEAEKKLESRDLVIGPAGDGGYYLLALRHPYRELFDGVPWSKSEVLKTSLQIAGKLGLKTSFLRTLWDIDLPDDWTIYQMLQKEMRKR